MRRTWERVGALWFEGYAVEEPVMGGTGFGSFGSLLEASREIDEWVSKHGPHSGVPRVEGRFEELGSPAKTFGRFIPKKTTIWVGNPSKTVAHGPGYQYGPIVVYGWLAGCLIRSEYGEYRWMWE